MIDWDRWYNGDRAHYTIYWAATGHKPGLSLMLGVTFRKHREKILANIMAHNPLFARLKAH